MVIRWSYLHTGNCQIPSYLHNGNSVTPSYLHNGNSVTTSYLHNGNSVTASYIHNGNSVTPSYLHIGNSVTPSYLHIRNSVTVKPSYLHNGNSFTPSYLHNGNFIHHFDGLVPDCGNSTANTLELLQSCAKQSISSCWYLYPDSVSDLCFSQPARCSWFPVRFSNRQHYSPPGVISLRPILHSTNELITETLWKLLLF